MAKTKRHDNSPEKVKALQDNHEHYKWFDVFEANPTKRGYRDPLKNELISVTTEFTLGKKLSPVFIEPQLAMGLRKEPGFNHFGIDADKNSGGGPAQIYLPMDKFSTGEVIKWWDMAKILQLPKDYENSVRLRRYEELGGGVEKDSYEDAYDFENKAPGTAAKPRQENTNS